MAVCDEIGYAESGGLEILRLKKGDGPATFQACGPVAGATSSSHNAHQQAVR